MAKLLLLHGNGGTRTRFLPFLDRLQSKSVDLEPFIPELAGFEGRVLPKLPDPKAYWDLFLENIWKTVKPSAEEDWIFYGHGIGGSLLMELAARDYYFPNGIQVKPRKLILHSCIGASLKKRFFPKLMKPMFVRKTMQSLVASPWMQSIWEKKLFQHPENIDEDLKKQFFQDYKNCHAFAVFFDMITPQWYQKTYPKIDNQPVIFLWGDQERVVAAKYLDLWKADFPQAQFELVAGWDHFPMLDDPDTFTKKLLETIQISSKASEHP